MQIGRARVGVISSVLIFICAFTSGCATSAPTWVKIEEPSFETVGAAPLAAGVTKASFQMPQRKEPTSVSAPEIAPGYTIRLSDSQDSKLNGQFQIAEDGSVALPYGVKIASTGKSLAEFQTLVTDAYRPYFRATPQTKVEVLEKKLWVEVGGLVEKPGPFLVRSDASLDEVIAAAGGLQKANDQMPLARFVRVQQGNEIRLMRLSEYYSGRQSETLQWRGGDQIFFQREGGGLLAANGENLGNIQILGQIKSPGEYAYSSQNDFFYYLTEAGGFTDRADINNLMLVRSENGERKSLNFSMDQVKMLPEIKAGDLILVQADNPSRTEKGTRIMSEVGQFFGSIATSVLLLVAL